ncbi:MAG: hypothetical protein H8E63_07220 [Proteobacteria bacterium]|nr:hypothetical protein [Pseudomonadota bacterium]
MHFEFWCRWLLGASAFFVGFGVVAAIAPHSGLFDLWIGEIDNHFFAGEIGASALEMRGFLMGPLGATISGSYLLQVFVIAVPFRNREAWAWHAVLWSTLLWFVVDSTMSAVHGAYFNIYLINLMPLILFGIPLAATRSMLSSTR